MAKLLLDWNEYINTARELVSEGCVLLENNGVLPLTSGSKLSIFGRIQTKYYKSGTGSGGMVNVSKVINIPDGLRNSGKVELNEELYSVYEKWEESHPFNEGVGWGTEPWSQEEMELTDELARSAADFSDTAIVIIGRTAGEDRDNTLEKGAFLLSDIEREMLQTVRKNFKKMIILLNVASLMDMSMIDDYKPDAVLLVWTGGMVGGDGIADVLTGKCPSGRLPDTVAYKVEDYPSHNDFGDEVRNFYTEDIFVGYRYFETFAKDKVRYPFGYGLSYTKFDITFLSANVQDSNIKFTCKVTNTGEYSGKQVVQIYVKAAAGKLSKAARVLVGYGKTKELAPGESQEIIITADKMNFASYDDSGVTGHQAAWILEKGSYEFYIGDNVRTAEKVYELELEEEILEQLESALKPVLPFRRMVAKKQGDEYIVDYEDAAIEEAGEEKRRISNMPALIEQIPYGGAQLKDVRDGNITMDQFIAQLSDDDLVCLVRGEGMGSSLVTPGTASAFAGVSESLRNKGIPAVCCDDGPSGMRLDSGALAFSLPSGMIISSSFNDDLVEKLYCYLSLEMKVNRVECLLGPGMNIQRYPLNGRNFEYFSEDPFLTGRMAIANLKGLNKYGVTGCGKHFCGNNQEKARHRADSVISERALREIYLKGFEMAVKSGELKAIMTTYGSVNGLWTAGSYDLTTTILRKQWGYDGIVMTDWWAEINERNKPSDKVNFAQMVRAQNDLYMCVSDAEHAPRSDSFVSEEVKFSDFATAGKGGDNLWESLENASLTKNELQRSAKNILSFAMNTEAMKRLLGEADQVEVVGREDSSEIENISLEDYISFDEEITIDLTYKESVAGTDYIIPLEIKEVGMYEISIAASSELSEIAQLPCTIYYTGVPFATFTFNGTAGKVVTQTRVMPCHNRFGLIRLNVARNGLKLESITFKLKK